MKAVNVLDQLNVFDAVIPRKLEQFTIHLLIITGRPVGPVTQQMWNYFWQIAPEYPVVSGFRLFSSD